MVQLHVLNGASAGARVAPEKFPVTVGRAPANSVALSEPGVFDTHFEIQFTPEGFRLAHAENAPTAINGQPAESGVILRNGDIINAGYAKVQFWLGAMPQRGLKARELAAWMLILAVAALQIYCLARLLAMAHS